MSWLWCTCVTASVLVLTAPPAAEAGYGKTCTPERLNEGPMPHTLCGNRLTEALDTICDLQGFMANPNRRKREEKGRAMALHDILINHREASDYLGKRGDVERVGIVCECCMNQCNIQELMEYCDFRSKRSPVLSHGEDDG